MKNILVPCDLSKASVQAVDYAVKLASKQKGKVTLLHSVLLTFANDSVMATGGRLTHGGRFFQQIKANVEETFQNIVVREKFRAPDSLHVLQYIRFIC
jgi:nucleotide-binding universal stress UspA family protein